MAWSPRNSRPPPVTRRKSAIQAAWLAGDTEAVRRLAVEAAGIAPRKRKPRSMREAGANDALKEWRRCRPDVRMWRNNVGAYPLPGGGFLRYGLCPGSADFIGLHSVVVTPAMVGKRVAVFLAVESKAPGKDAASHQETWLGEVKAAGGIAGVAHNAEEAEGLLAQWMAEVGSDER